MVFFTFLTFYSAYFDKVTDCGCFGDAIKLTPWQSFIKDIILMVPVLHLFWHRRDYQPLLKETAGAVVLGAATIICLFLGVYAIRHLPFVDFRAYRIGNHIPTQMQPEEQPVFEYVFARKDNGEQVRSQKYLSDTTQYRYVSVVQLNEEKTRPKITDFAVTSVDGEDLTANIFTGPKLIFVISDVRAASVANMDRIVRLAHALDGKVDMMVLTSSDAASFEAFRHEYQLAVPYFFTDATVLKTIIRANPGITLWVDGTVKGKWHHNDTPDAPDVLSLISTP
jgi:hypothetical protein